MMALCSSRIVAAAARHIPRTATKMRTFSCFLVLALAALSASMPNGQYQRPYGYYGQRRSYGRQGGLTSVPYRYRGYSSRPGSLSTGPKVVGVVGGPAPIAGGAVQVKQPHGGYVTPTKERYYYSWRASDLNPRDKYTWKQADYECSSRGYKLVTLDTYEKNEYVSAQVAKDDISYIWTSGTRKYVGFVWGDGSRVDAGFTNWSPTGADGHPQPDDREKPENCMAVLNNAYDDGVVWHDINCERQKHFVCEIY